MIGSQIKVVKYEPTDPRLGRHVEHDERSFSFANLPKMSRPRHVDTHWTSHAPPLDQGNVGSCTCSSEMTWLNTDFATAARQAALGSAARYFTQQDALDLYALTTRKFDHIPGFYPEEDTGSTGNAAAKAGVYKKYLKSYGWIFSFMSLQAQIEKSPVMFGSLWTNQMFNPVNGIVKVGKLTDSNIAGGHEYCMTGIVWNDELFEFRQTWGDQWDGSKPGGYFAMSFDDVRTLQEADGDVTVPRIA